MRVTGVPAPVLANCIGCVTAIGDDAYDSLADASQMGYCEETSRSDLAADCATAPKGMLQLGKPAAGRARGGGAVTGTTVLATPRDCLLYLALNCPRARYASVSVSERDCSWYASCQLNGLRQSGLGHRTFVLDDERTKALLGVPSRP